MQSEKKRHGPSPWRNSEHGYVLPVLSKALLVLEILESEHVPQKQQEIHRRTGIAKPTLYRILKTLVLLGYAIETPEHTFLKATGPRGHKIQIGFGTSSHHWYGHRDLVANLRKLAGAWGVNLLVLDNEDGKQAAVRNANEFIRAQVEVIFESFVDPQFSPIVGEMFRTVGKPVIAIENPLPDATYFGMNHYRAGFDAGERLAQFAERTWSGKADFFVGVCSDVGLRSDQLNSGRLRIQGAFASVRSAIRLGGQRGCEIIAAAGIGNIRDRVRVLFARHGADARILILAADEEAETETARAICEGQRQASTAIVGFGSGTKMRKPQTEASSAIVASVYCDTATYARELLEIGLAMRAGNVIPPYNHARHVILDYFPRPELTFQSSGLVQQDAVFAPIHS